MFIMPKGQTPYRNLLDDDEDDEDEDCEEPWGLPLYP